MPIEKDEQSFSSYYRINLECYSGVAWVVLGWEIAHDGQSEFHEEGDMIRTGKVVACMVGDDKNHVFDLDELISINDDEFCAGCGQIGCSH